MEESASHYFEMMPKEPRDYEKSKKYKIEETPKMKMLRSVQDLSIATLLSKTSDKIVQI